MPAIKSTLICAKFSARAFVRGEHFARTMRPPVDLENMVVEILNAQAQTGDADLLDRGELPRIQRPGFGFKRDFLRRIPRQDRFQPIREFTQLFRRQIGGRAATEINEVRLATLHERTLGE
jgi:hypothetical protein